MFPFFALQLHNSSNTQVVLQSVNLSSSGRYRCEVSAEAPSFQTVTDHGDMIVVGEFLILINGIFPKYNISVYIIEYLYKKILILLIINKKF